MLENVTLTFPESCGFSHFLLRELV
eukprot:COSAG01_NODE_26090_length_723_cov_9.018248_1_plen_24_part_10